MESPLSPDFLPVKRAGAVLLLESVGWNLDLLTEPQCQAIRRLYFVRDNRSIEQLVRDGELQP